jgi:hypothetical protein
MENTTEKRKWVTPEIFGEDINGTKGKDYFPIETSTPYLSNGPS